MLWVLLTQFVFRMTLGIAVAMFFTSAKQVTSGFFRVHLWVLLGLNTLALLIVFTSPNDFSRENLLFRLVVATVIASYVGSALWLFEQQKAGKWALLIVAGLAFSSLWADSIGTDSGVADITWLMGHAVTSALLIGTTMTAMFLGHWYLNTPTMQLDPLRRLVCSVQIALLARVLFCVVGISSLLLGLDSVGELTASGLTITLLAIRWIGGLLGVGLMAWMTWQTLRIPNTQSATGILYVGVILVFLGELSSQLLSAQTGFLV